MKSHPRYAVFLILVIAVLIFNGCATLGAIGSVPGALIGGIFRVIGTVFNFAKKLPWWMWV